MKRITKVVLILITLLLSASGCSGSSENWAYKGFIIEVYENARGETEIVTLSGDVESHFVIKEKTKISAPAEVPFNIGGYIMLNTTGTSDGNVKECKVVPGRMNEGRLVYVEGDDSPYILTELLEGRRLFAKLIDDGQNLQPGTSGMGDVIRVYHRDVVDLTDPTIAVEGLIYVENGSFADLTDEDIAFIESHGFKVKSE